MPQQIGHIVCVRCLAVLAQRCAVAVAVKAALKFGGRKATNAEVFLDELGFAAQRDRLRRDLATVAVDEIGAGLNPSELAEIACLLTRLARPGIALLVEEHLLKFLNRISNRAIVLNAGAKLFEGTLKDALADPEVVAAFLGG